MQYSSKQAEEQALLQTAFAMCAAARTAPKARGLDYLETLVLTGAEKDALADEMERLGATPDTAFFVRDADNVRTCGAVVLLGYKNVRRGLGESCGMCGHTDCAACASCGGACAFTHVDLGIAAGAAAAAAAAARVDNRIMFSIGRAAVSLGLLSERINDVLGIPLSISGKSPFFDRK